MRRDSHMQLPIRQQTKLRALARQSRAFDRLGAYRRTGLDDVDQAGELRATVVLLSRLLVADGVTFSRHRFSLNAAYRRSVVREHVRAIGQFVVYPCAWASRGVLSCRDLGDALTLLENVMRAGHGGVDHERLFEDRAYRRRVVAQHLHCRTLRSSSLLVAMRCRALREQEAATRAHNEFKRGLAHLIRSLSWTRPPARTAEVRPR